MLKKAKCEKESLHVCYYWPEPTVMVKGQGVWLSHHA